MPKSFNISTPVLKLDFEEGSYYLGDREMLYWYHLSKLFELNEHPKISLRLSSKARPESVAMEICKYSHCCGTFGIGYLTWQKRGRPRTDIATILFNAHQWLRTKRRIFRDMKDGDKIIVHVTVSLHEIG